jgi:RNA polymerase sigma-70 factor, ECF subfamily
MSQLSDPNTWLDQHGDALFRYALLRTRNTAQAEDMVQETLLAALKARVNFAGASSERTWFIGILNHKIIDCFRQTYRERSLTDRSSEDDGISNELFDEEGHWTNPLSTWINPDLAFEQQQFWDTLAECLARLPSHLAELFTLREIHGMDTKEVCKVLNISTTNNAWVKLSRAHMQLRQCLEVKWFGRRPA